MPKSTNDTRDSSVLSIDPALQRKMDAFCKRNSIQSAAFYLQDHDDFFTYYAYRDGKGNVVAANGPIFI